MPRIRPHLLNARNRMISRHLAVKVSNRLDIGDWWLIYMLGRNLDPIIFRDVMTELADELDKHDDENDDEQDDEKK